MGQVRPPGQCNIVSEREAKRLPYGFNRMLWIQKRLAIIVGDGFPVPRTKYSTLKLVTLPRMGNPTMKMKLSMNQKDGSFDSPKTITAASYPF